MRAIPIIVAAIGVSLIYLLASWTMVYFSLGIIGSANTTAIGLAVVAGGTALLLVALIAVGFCVRAALNRNLSQLAACCVAAGALVAAPMVAKSTVATVAHRAELRDLERVGIGTLRAEAAALIATHAGKQFPQGRLGRRIPPEDVPPALRRLSAHAGSIEVSDSNVGFITDGLGSWRAGYIITPPHSTFVPQGAREVAEGIYYVTVR